MSSMSNKDQIEFGDHSERMTNTLAQNRELKELVIIKENTINTLKMSNIKMEKELQNIMDPISKNSQLKAVRFALNIRNTKKSSPKKTIK